MTDSEYRHLAERLTAAGADLAAIESKLRDLQIETPSWGYGDSGTRFGVFPQAGRPRDVFERIEDAAATQRLTGNASAVALHFPWDQIEDYGELKAAIANAGLSVGAINPNLFGDPDYKLGSITNPDAGVRAKALEHLHQCLQIGTTLEATGQSLWLADGTNYAGQDDFSARRDRLEESLHAWYQEFPVEQEMYIEYKFFEPAFYATDLADWGSALLIAQSLGDQAKVLVDLGHHAQGVNIEQIVNLVQRAGKLGGFHFNNRKYADDDLIVGSVNPLELFFIFVELTAAGKTLPRLTIDQSHNVEQKLEAMVRSVMNLQESYAKALLVDRAALLAAQEAGDVLAGHEVLLDAFNTDVRPLTAHIRTELGAAANPIAELRGSGYLARRIAERDSQTIELKG